MRIHLAFAMLVGFAGLCAQAVAQEFCELAFRDSFQIGGNNALAVDDQVSTFEGVDVIIDVLANDHDPRGTADPNHCPVSLAAEIVIRRLPSSSTGTVEALQGTGNVRFEPAAGFVGTTDFDYDFLFPAPNGGSVRSNRATVTVEVLSNAPEAIDDRVLSCEGQLLIHVLDNDRVPFGGPFMDLTTIQTSGVSSPVDAVLIKNDGVINFLTSRTPPYSTSFQYSVANTAGRRSEEATVTVDCLEAFVGEDEHLPIDGVNVIQLYNWTLWRGLSLFGGFGAAAGFMHADPSTVNGCAFVGDHTQSCPRDARTLPAVADSFNLTTEEQTFSANILPDGTTEFVGLTPEPLFPAFDSPVDITPTDSAKPVETATAPGAPESTNLLDELIAEMERDLVIGVLNHLYRLAEAVPERRVTRSSPQPQVEPRVIIEADPEPLEDDDVILVDSDPRERTLARGSAARVRMMLLPETTRHTMTSSGQTVTGLAVAALVSRQDSTSLFTAPGQRPVPIRLGHGVAVPGSTLTPPRFDACLQPPDEPLCNYGPHPRLLAANQNGDVTVHDPVDGSLLYHLLGGGAPNFTVDNGWHIIQDPNTACLLFSDSGNNAIHRYNTQGQLMNASFISTGSGSSPRGLDFLQGDLLVATRGDGRVRRYTSNGVFVADQITGTGNPNAVFTLPGGDLLVADESGTSGTRTVRRYPFNGGTPETMIAGLGLAYQISQDFDGHYLLAHFGLGQVQVFNFGFPNIAAPSLGTNDGGSARSPRGVAPLRNGKWLVTGSNGTGVSVLDPNQPEALTEIVAGNTFRFIEPACLPQ